MVSRHSKNSSGPKFQMGKPGSFHANTHITKKSESVMMPQRTSLFPGWLLKISQNAYAVSTAIPIVRIVETPPIKVTGKQTYFLAVGGAMPLRRR